jgi:hypothetical protein
MDAIAKRALQRRLEHERDYGKREILSSAELLIARLHQVVKNVESGEHVNPHLIANFAMLTEAIARWNISIEVTPFLDFTPEGKTK